MATNSAQLDGVWDQPAQIYNTHPYMQADLRFRSPESLKRLRKPVQPVTLNVLGVEIKWTPDGREFPPAILKAIERLYAIHELNDGWDSYGGKALNESVIAATLKFVFFSHHRGSPCPRLTPLNNGGIGLRWETPAKEVDLDIIPDGSFEITVEDVALGDVREYPANTIIEAEQVLESAL